MRKIKKYCPTSQECIIYINVNLIVLAATEWRLLTIGVKQTVNVNIDTTL